MKVISIKQLPAKLPYPQTFIWILLKHDYKVAQWLQGIIWFILGVMWVGTIILIAREDRVMIKLEESDE